MIVVSAMPPWYVFIDTHLVFGLSIAPCYLYGNLMKQTHHAYSVDIWNRLKPVWVLHVFWKTFQVKEVNIELGPWDGE